MNNLHSNHSWLFGLGLIVALIGATTSTGLLAGWSMILLGHPISLAEAV
jgi:hypothetical protein